MTKGLSKAMGTKILVDADILIKLSVLDCFEDSFGAIGLQIAETATLHSMTLSAGVRNAGVRMRKARSGAGASRLLSTLTTIPTIDRLDQVELQLSASLIKASQQLGLAVDGGEAILVSICIHRNISLLTTGDKRAIRSLPLISRCVPQVASLGSKVIPLEGLLLKLTQKVGLATLLTRFNANSGCDGALEHALMIADGDQVVFEHELKRRLSTLRRTAGNYLAC